MKSLNSTFQVLFISVLFSFFSFFSWTQSYTATASSTNFVSASWTNLSSGQDDATFTIPIGFDIPYFGTNYSTAYVSTNGWFSFISPAGSWPANYVIGSGTGPDGVIAPYWDDLRDNGGNDQLRYSIGGTAPNRYFAIDYYSFSWYCGSGYSYIQAVIYESGIIDFNYGYSGGTTWSDPTCASASIGITQPGGGEFYCGANCGSTYNSGSRPQHYRFTPRPPCATNLSPSNGATDLSYNSPTLSWNAVDLADAYDVYIGTLSQLTGSGLPLVSNNQAGTSYSPSGLSASTTYYWQVVPTNNISGDASGCSAQSFTTEAVIPLITTSGSLSAFSSCSGTASSSDSFTVSGADMEAGITVTAPTGYEVSTDNTSFSSSLVVGSSGTISSTTIYVRLANAASGSPSGNVVCSSTNASSQNVAASGTVSESPTADAGSDVSHCNGSSSVLSGSGAISEPAPAIPSGYANSYATSTMDTYISNVTFNSISTSTGINTANVETDNTGTVITVDKGSSYTLSITTADDGGASYTHGIRAYIDWNRDGDFADAEETVYSSGGYVPAGTVSTTVSVPSGASDGDMMLRVVANEGTPAPSATGTYSYGETEKYTVRVNPSVNYSWSTSADLDNSAIAGPTASNTSTRTYTLTVTASNGCTASDDVIATVYENPVAGSVAVTDLSVSGNSDLTEAIEADQITWTNTGTANGNIQYFYEWTDNSGSSPTGAWNAWVTSNPNVWNANSSGGNMNRTLWVKTVTTSTNGCGTAESSTTWIDVRNCRAGATGATVSAGTVANMPFGETITYTATMDDGAWERFQYQWGGTGGNWVNWNDANTNPYSYTTDANAGQTLYVRSQVFGPAIGTATCTDYSDPVQTLLIDCANTVTADAGSDEVVCNGSSVVLAGSGSGSSAVTGYSWSPSTELSSSTIAGPTSSATSSRTYTLTTTHADGCTATDAVVVSVNEAPSNSSVAISSASTPPKNSEDLSASVTTSDPESATVYSENDWRVDGTSFAVQNFSFDADGSDGLTSNSSQGGALTANGDATQVAGVKGQAYEFDGDTDYLQNSSLNIDPTQGLSVSLWTYTESLGSGAQRWFNLGGDGSGELFVLRKTSSNAVEGYIKTGGNHSNWCSGCSSGDFIYLNGQVTTGSNNTGWQHWVMTWDGQTSNGQMKLYLDGSLIHTTTTAAGGLIPITSLYINQNNSTGWNGKIDELLIFERDISADQVTAMYNSGTPSYSTIADDETSCGEAWTLASTPVDVVGCNGSATTSTGVSISGAQVATADVTDYSTTCGVQTYDIAIDDLTASGSWEVSPQSAVLFDDATSQSATITIDPTQNQFNENLTLTWTPTDGNCSSDNCVIRFSAPNVTGSMDTYCWAWGGLTNTAWATGSNWYKWNGIQWVVQTGSNAPDAGDKVYVLPTSDVCVSNDVTNAGTSFGDLNIQSGGSFDLGSTNTSITGNITNDGTMQGGTGTVTLSGSTDQTISGSGTVSFNNLTVNKSSGSAIISTQTDIRNTLTMTKGNIVNSQPVVIGVNSSSPGTLSHASGIVTGELRRYFANATGSTFFPVGTSSSMRDVTINFTQPPGTDEYLTVSYLSGAPTLGGAEGAYSGLPLVTSDNQLIQNYSADGHWNIDPTGGLYESTEINNANYEMTLHCKALSIQPTDVSKVRIIKSAGSENSSINHVTWTGLDLLSSSGIPADFTITAAAQGFSKFGAGSDDGNALPVELVSFNGSCNDGVVELNWETASEYNSSHFDVENSRDGITWDVVKTIDAAGNSNELLTYTYGDVSAHGGDNYYRLHQVDIDGTSKTYDVINVSCSQTTSGYFSIFPNPSSGSFQVILNNAEIIGDARMNVVDTKGNMVLSKSLDVKSGINMYVVNEVLAPGIYYVSVQNGDKVTVVLKHSVK